MRLPLAFLLAPPAPLLLLWVVWLLYSNLVSLRAPTADEVGMSVFVGLFGIGYGYLAAAMLGIPAYFALRAVRRLTDASITITATLIGAVAGWVPFEEWRAAGIGAILGTVAGYVFAVISRPDRELPVWPPWAA